MIKGLFYLNETNFVLQPSPDGKGKLLTIAEEKGLSDLREGLTLVLFYSNNCTYCDSTLLEYKQLPKSLLGCNFSMINLNNNSKLISMTKETINPITFVPEIVLYYNSLPYVHYEGEHKVDDIKSFIMTISSKLEQSLSFVSKKEITSEEIISEKPKIEMIKPYKKTKRGVCYVKGNKLICDE